MKVGDYVRTKDGRIYKIGDIGNFIYLVMNQKD